MIDFSVNTKAEDLYNSLLHIKPSQGCAPVLTKQVKDIFDSYKEAYIPKNFRNTVLRNLNIRYAPFIMLVTCLTGNIAYTRHPYLSITTAVGALGILWLYARKHVVKQDFENKIKTTVKFYTEEMTPVMEKISQYIQEQTQQALENKDAPKILQLESELKALKYRKIYVIDDAYLSAGIGITATAIILKPLKEQIDHSLTDIDAYKNNLSRYQTLAS